MQWEKEPAGEEKEVTLHVVVEDKVNGKELVNKDITQTGQINTLYDFLEKCEELDVVFKDGSYGAYIDEMSGLKQDLTRDHGGSMKVTITKHVKKVGCVLL